MATTYLSRTPSSNGNLKICTWSGWVKRGALGTRQMLFSANNSGTGLGENIEFTTGNKLEYDQDKAGTDWTVSSDMLFRDVSAWYHIVFAKDTTQATESDRIKIYVNGTQISLTESANGYPTQNYDGFFNDTSYPNYIGAINNAHGDYFDGSISHIHFIDGTAYAASTFGETDSTTGIWKPKTAPSVTYGTNGFFLKFENSAAFGTDSSGNSNTFTVNGTMTQAIDTPSNVFATGNPLNVPASSPPTFTNGNTTWTSSGNETNNFGGSSTLGVTQGKYYIEAKATLDETYSRNAVGISGEVSTLARNNSTGGSNSTIYYDSDTGNKVVNGSGSAYGNTYTTGDIIGIALDLDNAYVYFSKNGTWQNSGDPTSGSTGTGGIAVTAVTSSTDGAYFIFQSDTSGVASTPSKFDFNFGNGYFGTTAVSSAQNPDDGIGIFEYDVPAGYRALNTKSINAEEYS